MLQTQHGAGLRSERMVIACAKNGDILDIASNGVCGDFTGKTLQVFQSQYPDAALVQEHVAIAIHDKAKSSEILEISAARFNDMLEVLPPQGWHRARFSESFKLAERYSGNITSIFVRMGQYVPRYFTYRGHHQTEHSKVFGKALACIESIDQLQAASRVERVVTVMMNAVANVAERQAVSDWAWDNACYVGVNGHDMRMVEFGEPDAQRPLVPWSVVANSEMASLAPDFAVFSSVNPSVPTVSSVARVDMRSLCESKAMPVLEQEQCFAWIRSAACMTQAREPSTDQQFILQVEADQPGCPAVLQQAMADASAKGAGYLLISMPS